MFAYHHARAARRARLITLVACFLGFGLAVHSLQARGLWGDEAFSVWASKQPALALVAGLDAQPPLYHLLLACDRALFGESVFAIRFLSLVGGVLLIAVGARLALEMAGAFTASFVALFLATSPILIYFAQEARMYTPAALFAGAAMWCAYGLLYPRHSQGARHPEGTQPLRDLRDAPRRPQPTSTLPTWLAYLCFSLAALFTHFYTAGVLLVSSVALGISALRKGDIRRMVGWTLAHGALTLVFGGWFFGLQSHYVATSAAKHSRIVPDVNEIASNIGRGIEGLVFGMRADGSTQIIALALFALALAGLVGYWRAGKRAEAALTGGWVMLALGLVLFTAGKTGIVSDFSPRYFLFALLPLGLAAGGWFIMPSAVYARGSPVSVAAPRVLLTAFALVPGLMGNIQLLDLGWQKSRYDALAHEIETRARPGDTVVMVNSDQFPLVDYYGPHDLPAWIVDNNALSGDKGALAARLDSVTHAAQRVWLVNYGWAMQLQASSPVEQFLNARGPRIYAHGFQDASLALYDLRMTGNDVPVTAKDVDFDGQFKLTGVRERATHYQPGQSITLDLIWRAENAPKANYTVFMHLRRAADGGQIAANDSAPMNGASQTSSWSPGQLITDTHAVQIPASATPGDYNVIIGWYLYPSFERLHVTLDGTTEVVASRVTIQP